MFYRTYFKILIIIFKAIHGMLPSYISDFVSIRTCSSYLLRSHHSIVFEHPNERMLATLGARSFSAAAPSLDGFTLEFPIVLKTNLCERFLFHLTDLD